MTLGTLQHQPRLTWLPNYKIIVVVCLFLFASLSWGACYIRPYQWGNCMSGMPLCAGSSSNWTEGSTCSVDDGMTVYSYCQYNQWNKGYYVSLHCDTRADAQKYQCEQQGGTWDGTSCHTKPNADETCSDEKSACESIPGATYTPQHVDKGDGTWRCTGICNVCNTQYWKALKSRLTQLCCDGGMAPPSFDNPNNYCSASIADDGQVWGLGCSNSSGNCKCQSPEWGDMSRCLDYDYDYGDEPGTEAPPDTSTAPIDSLGDGEGDWEYNYYPILDSIRDSVSNSIAPSLRTIATCLATGSCVGGGDTVIVNASGGFDSTLMTNTKKSIDSIHIYMGQGLDTLVDTLRKYQTNTETFVGNAVDSLIDSVKKHLDDGTSKLKNAMDSINGKIDTLWNRAPGGADTATWSQHGDSWFTEGQNISDTILGSNGYSDLDFGADSAMIDSLVLKGYTCVGDSCCLDGNTFCIHWTQDSVIVDSLAMHQTRLHDSLSKMNEEFVKDSIPSIIQSVYDSVKAINPFGIFDSTIMQDLGATIPNTNTCPDHCSKFEVKIPFFFGMVELPVDYGLCLGRAVFGGGNVLSVIRFIIRLIVAWTCIALVMWEVARHK